MVGANSLLRWGAVVLASQQQMILCRRARVGLGLRSGLGRRSRSQRFHERHEGYQQQRPNSYYRPQRTGQDRDRYASNWGHGCPGVGKPDAGADGRHRSNKCTAQIHSQHLGHTLLVAATSLPE